LVLCHSGTSGKSAGEAVRAALPSAALELDADFRRVVFGLARQLKAVPEFRHEPIGAVRGSVQAWFDQARQFLPGRSFTDVWAEFVAGWKKVRYAAGDDPVTRAWETIQGQPAPPEAEQYDDARIGRLIALCRQLQHDGGGGSFYLSGERAGELFGVTQPVAAKWLAMLVADNVLEVVDQGGGFRGGRRTARQYRMATAGR
jgi:hypothetical protein